MGKQQLAALQSTMDQHIADAQQKESEMENQQGIFDSITTPHHVRAMQEGVVQKQRSRRHSLTEAKEALESIGAKLETAETSWSPWADVNDAKQVVADIQSIVGQKVEEGKPEGSTAGQQDDGKLL